VPLQFSVAEFDPAEFHSQAAQVVRDFMSAKGVYPEMHWLAGHNHLSPALSIGSGLGGSEALVAGFVARVAG
jgi:triacylglycerol lipase